MINKKSNLNLILFVQKKKKRKILRKTTIIIFLPYPTHPPPHPPTTCNGTPCSKSKFFKRTHFFSNLMCSKNTFPTLIYEFDNYFSNTL